MRTFSRLPILGGVIVAACACGVDTRGPSPMVPTLELRSDEPIALPIAVTAKETEPPATLARR